MIFILHRYAHPMHCLHLINPGNIGASLKEAE